MYLEANFEPIVDFIGKMETIDKDYEHLKNILGLKRKLPHLNQSRHDDYRLYYTDELRKRVGQMFARDVEHFKYEF
jgi:hypothetical protein